MSHETNQFSADSIRAAFDAVEQFTLGVEEELMLLDPESLDLAPRARELLERVRGDARFKLELPAAQLEIVSPPLGSVPEAAGFLVRARRDLSAAASGLVRLGCSGVHPFAAAEGEFNSGERYERTLNEYGRVARRQLVFALQVHVAVPGAERALAVYNAMRSYLPELLALSANAPFWDGEDTGLATMRPKLGEQLPRQGVPPAIDSWDEFAGALAWGASSGTVPEPRVWWWELRPHPLYGTIEVRVADAQTTVEEASAVMAVVHSLAAWLAARFDAGDALHVAPTWRIEENRWSALRNGVEGTLADLASGERVETRERLGAVLVLLAPTAVELGCAAELDLARAMVEENGAMRQRRAAGSGGDLRALVDWLATSYI